MALIEKQHVSIATMCVVIIAIASGVFVIGRWTEKIDTALTTLSEHIGEIAPRIQGKETPEES